MKRAHTLLVSCLAFVTISSPLYAKHHRETFAEGKKHLEQAFKISKLPIAAIEDYRDYRKGPRNFHVSADTAPWGGYYFPMNSGGITQRWQRKGFDAPGVANHFHPLNYIKVEEEQDPFEANSFEQPEYHYEKISAEETRKRILAMSEDEIDTLSPVEKFDLYKGDYNFSATNYEKFQHGEYRRGFLLLKYWNGFCNGARAAGALSPEPIKPITVVNKDGIKITFQPADLKALLSASYFYPEYTAYLGFKTKLELRKLNSNPPNAAAFDIALRSYLAKFKYKFFMDKDPTHHLANVTIIGYKRRILKIRKIKSKERKKYHLPASAVQAIDIKNKIEYLGEVPVKESNGPTKAKIAAGEYSSTLTARYTLYVDKDNRIVEGQMTRRYLGVPYVLSKGIDLVWFAAGQGDYHEWLDFSKKPDENGLYPHAGNKDLDYPTIMQLVNQAAE